MKKLVIIGTGLVESCILKEVSPVVIAWLFNGIKIELKNKVFLFRFEHSVGPRGIDETTRLCAQSQTNDKILQIGETFLSIKSIIAAYILPDGIVAICKAGVDTTDVAMEVANAVRGLFEIAGDMEVTVDLQSQIAMAQFFSK